MVWDEESSVILMLNKVIENNRIKCHPYWPTGSVDEDGDVDDIFEVDDFKVELKQKLDYDFYAISELTLRNKELFDERIIYHLHYYNWPDFGVPESPETFLQFLEVARGYYKMSLGPPVVHCSAGIGRTGTLVLVDTILKIIEKESTLNVDIYSILIHMRQQRLGLVQTPDQLRFCFLAILEGSKKFDWSTFNTKRIQAQLSPPSESSEGSVRYLDSDDLLTESDESDSNMQELNTNANPLNANNPPDDNEDEALVPDPYHQDEPAAETLDVFQNEKSAISLAEVEVEVVNELSVPPESESESVVVESVDGDENKKRGEEKDSSGDNEKDEGISSGADEESSVIAQTNSSDIKKRKAKTSELVSDMKKRLKRHEDSQERKLYYWQSFGKPLFIGTLAAVGLSVIVYLMR